MYTMYTTDPVSPCKDSAAAPKDDRIHTRQLATKTSSPYAIGLMMRKKSCEGLHKVYEASL